MAASELHIIFELEHASKEFDVLLELVEQGKEVGIAQNGKLRGILKPIVGSNRVAVSNCQRGAQ